MLSKGLLIFILKMAGIVLTIFFTSCNAPSKDESSTVEQGEITVLEVIVEDDQSQKDEPIIVPETEVEDSITESPSGSNPAEPYIQVSENQLILKPYFPEGITYELILKSKPIPGKPIIAIYKVWEGSSSEKITETQDNTIPEKIPEPEIAPVIKPEPTIAITPEPTVIPEPAPVIEPDNVSAPLVGIQPPQPEIEQTPPIIIEQDPEPITIVTEPQPTIEPDPTPVIEPDNVSTPLVGVQPTQPVVAEQTQPVISDTAPPHIAVISPTSGTFYTKKIQIEGQISSSAENLNSVKDIGKVTWEIEGKKSPEELFFGSDGVFFLSFPASEYSGTIDILIKAEKEDGASKEYKLTIFDGNVHPELTLKSPAEGSSYGAAIRISGNVTDPSASDLKLTGPASLEYSLFPVDDSSSGEQISGTIPVDTDGRFSTVIFSNDFSGEQLVTITVHGRNGKTLESSITIVEAKSDIPGFFADQEDGVVKLSWDSLPGIESYNLFYADAGIDPAGTSGSKFADVKSPVLIRNFREGFLYRFQLEAVPLESDNSTGKTYWSDISETILLTSNTLKPVVTPGYQQLSLVWLNIPGTENFNILRKENSTGTWDIIKQNFTGTSYIDRDVVFGNNYSYQIRPSLEGSQPSAMVSAESLPFPEEKTVVMSGFGSSNLQDIVVAGSYIFLANGTGGVKIIDNADPANPLEVGRYPAEETKGIIIKGERAYIADGYRGIKILDINDPGNPILLGSRKTTDATKLALMKDTLFIADGKAGIKIIDISSERRPSRTGTLDTDFAKDILIHGAELFLADGPGGFKIIDFTNSPNLEIISNFECDDAVAIAVSGNTVFLADNGFGVRIINTSNSNNPVEIGQIPLTHITDILVNENYIFISDLAEGLLIYEVSDPQRPVLFDKVGFNDISALTLDNGVVYLTDNEGFKTVRSFTTGRSFVIAEYQTDGNAYNLTYIDNTLYLSDHRNGVKIVDVSNPTDSDTFSVTQELNTTYAESVVGYGSKLLIADGSGGLVLGEISYSEDGTQQIEVQESVDLPGITKSLAVYGNRAYIAAREEGMHLLNMETKEIDTIYTGGSVQEIAVNKNLIFIADGVNGLKIYSNIVSGTPKLLSTVKLTNAVTVAQMGSYVVAGGRDGLSVIDVSTPDKPVIISSFNAGWIEDIHLEPGYIYAAAGYEGLIVLDMRTPEDLVLVSSCEDVYAVGVEVEKDLAFVADVDGFKVVRILIPSWLQ